MAKLKSQKSKLKLFILAFFILAVGGGLGVARSEKWDGKSRFTVIYVDKGVRVASFDPQTGEGIRINFPQNWVIAGDGGQGEWLAEKAGRADLVAENLGILYTAEAAKMSWGDRLLWWWQGSKIKWREIDGQQWMKKEQTVDGVEVWKLDERWDTAAGEMLISSAVQKERLEVTVVNTTSTPGLAAQVARMLESSGLRVVATQTDETEIEGCQVRSSKQSKSKIGVKLMVKSMGCNWSEAKLGENEVELFFGQR